MQSDGQPNLPAVQKYVNELERKLSTDFDLFIGMYQKQIIQYYFISKHINSTLDISDHVDSLNQRIRSPYPKQLSLSKLKTRININNTNKIYLMLCALVKQEEVQQSVKVGNAGKKDQGEQTEVESK